MSAPEEKVTLQSLRDVEPDGTEIGLKSLNISVSAAGKLNEEIGRIIESENFQDNVMGRLDGDLRSNPARANHPVQKRETTNGQAERRKRQLK